MHKQIAIKEKANCDITLENCTLENCTQRKHSLRFLSHVLFQASAIESRKGGEEEGEATDIGAQRKNSDDR